MKYIGLAILTGLLLGFSFPTTGFPLLFFIGFVPLLWAEHQLIQREGKWKSLKIFGLAYFAFIIWNATAYSWLYHAKQYSQTSGTFENSFMAFFPPVLLNALFMALVFKLYSWLKKRSGNYYGLVFLPCIWMAFEKLHLTWEISWPWLNLGNGFAHYYQWIQWYEFTGTFGGTLWVWIVNLLIFHHGYAYWNVKEKKYLRKLVLYPLVWIVVPIIFSYVIYYNYEEKKDPIEVVLLQPELNPYFEKYNTSPDQIEQDLFRLTDAKITEKTHFIIAPETAYPGAAPGLNIDYLDREPFVQDWKNYLKKYPQASFVTGIELRKIYKDSLSKSETATRYRNSPFFYDVYNSAFQINNGIDLPVYHKSKLVVGIEHFPYAKILKPILGEALLNFGGTVRTHGTQEDRGVFKNEYNKAVVAPMICYESVFGEFSTGYVKNGANVIFIMTNDSWWDNTDGHRELLAFARLRAIENRRSIARSANSGVSAFINQRGDISQATSYETMTSIRGQVSLNQALTAYTKYGDLLARIGLFLAGVLLAYALAHKLLEGKKIQPLRKD